MLKYFVVLLMLATPASATYSYGKPDSYNGKPDPQPEPEPSREPENNPEAGNPEYCGHPSTEPCPVRPQPRPVLRDSAPGGQK